MRGAKRSRAECCRTLRFPSHSTLQATPHSGCWFRTPWFNTWRDLMPHAPSARMGYWWAASAPQLRTVSMPWLHRAAFGLALIASYQAIEGIAHQACAAQITHDGRELARKLDSFQVESHWPAGVHVDWRTGIPDGKPREDGGQAYALQRVRRIRRRAARRLYPSSAGAQPSATCQRTVRLARLQRRD